MGDQPMRERTCGHCKGRGYCYDLYGPDPEWCCECGGPGSYMTPVLPVGASARIGSNLAAAYHPHRSDAP